MITTAMLFRVFLYYCGIALVSVGISVHTAYPQSSAGKRYVVIIGGIGGEAVYVERNWTCASGLYAVLRDEHRLPEDQLFLLVEDPARAEVMPARKSSLTEIDNTFGALAQHVRPDDILIVIMIGHGSAIGADAKLNIPGPDLTASHLNDLIGALKPSRTVIVNAASASAPFIDILSAPNRVIITATKSGREHHATVFPEHFLAALSIANSDLDKDSQVSILEAFAYTRQKTAAWYEDEGKIATEHPLLDDNGDRIGSRDPGGEDADGQLARMITFGSQVEESVPLLLSDEGKTQLEALETRAVEIQSRIEALKLDKPNLTDADYTSRMRTLLLDLARVNNDMAQLKKTAR